MKSKTDDPAARRIATAGLHSLDSATMSRLAHEITSDETDHEDVRAAAFTLLTQVSGGETKQSIDAQAESLRHEENALGRSASAYLNRSGA